METLVYSETTQEFLDLLRAEGGYKTAPLNLLEEGKSRYLADLKINFKNSLESEFLTGVEIALLGVALATNNGNTVLTSFFVQEAKANDATPEAIAEAVACASLLSANNVLYRFRHFTKKEKYNEIPARIKMNIMGRPVNGKEFFELISLAISAVNGCEMCVNAHEASLIELGAREERIFEAVRLASIITSTSKVIF